MDQLISKQTLRNIGSNQTIEEKSLGLNLLIMWTNLWVWEQSA